MREAYLTDGAKMYAYVQDDELVLCFDMVIDEEHEGIEVETIDHQEIRIPSVSGVLASDLIEGALWDAVKKGVLAKSQS